MLALGGLIGTATITASFIYGGLEYENYADDRVVLVGSTLTSGMVAIPEKVTMTSGLHYYTYTVDSIAPYAFHVEKRQTLSVSPDLPSTIRGIGEYAFNCDFEISGGGAAFMSGTLNLPEGVKYIGVGAFSGTGLTEITVPESVVVYDKAFDQIPTLKKFNYNAINATGGFGPGWELDTITIGPNVETVDFGEYSYPEAKTVIINSEVLKSIGTISVDTDTVITPAGFFPKTLEKVTGALCGLNTVVKCGGYLHIPEKLTSLPYFAHFPMGKFKDLKKIYFGNDSLDFYHIFEFDNYDDKKNLDEIIVGDSVRTLHGTYSYQSINARKLTFTENCRVDSIGSLNLDSIRGSLTFPASLRVIGPNAFNGAKYLENIELPANLEKIDNSAFDGCTALTGTIDIPESLYQIGPGAFRDCTSLQGELLIPATVKYMGAASFWNTGFNKITYADSDEPLEFTDSPSSSGGWIIKAPAARGDNSETELEREVYQGRDLNYKVVSMDMSFSYAVCSPFNQDTTIVKVVAGDKVTNIGLYQYQDCSRLKDVTLGEKCDTLRRGAFSGCPLERLDIRGNMPVLQGGYWDSSTQGVFDETVPENCELFVREDLVAAYKAHPFWCRFFRINGEDSGVNAIPADENVIVISTYDFLGRKIDDGVPGFVIEKSSDGSTRKIIRK